MSSQVREGRVLLWSKGLDCPKTGRKTAMAKELLEKNQIEYEEIKVNHGSKKVQNEITAALALDTGFLAFPNIYFGTMHVGGLDDLKSHLQCKKAAERLKECASSSGSEGDGLAARQHFDFVRSHRFA